MQGSAGEPTQPQVPAERKVSFQGGIMNIKSFLSLVLALVSAAPLSAGGKKNQPERGMLERMDAVACGAKQRGLSGLGTLWASVGITHVNSDEKLCPQYLLRTDEMDYEIRPTDLKHASVLPINQEAEFKIKKNLMYLQVPEGTDRKMRAYEVVAMTPANSNSDAQNSPAKSHDRP